uniref:Uncharacterized protein n=1 Tax=Amphora coffeiformis TaxID=265554 RepID=A0A7S3L1H7_9STRA
MFSKILLFACLSLTTASNSLFPQKATRLELHTAAEERRNIVSTPAVRAGDPFVLQPENRRSLTEACQDDEVGACAFVSIFNDDVDVYSSCGGLAERKDDRWW